MPIQQRIAPHSHDLGGGFIVRRALPAPLRQAVGPFVFFDHFGPVAVGADDNFDVRAHPHIGLATVTYLFEGAMMHRDSLGLVQTIEPGAVNWMTAGRGIVHSERAPDALRGTSYVNHGLQLWCALPEEAEEIEPAFRHTPAADLPEASGPGWHLRVMVGALHGLTSPVETHSPTLYAHCDLAAGARFTLEADAAELAIYVVAGAITVDGAALPAGELAVLMPGAALLGAGEDTQLVVLGGTPLGHRHMVWNFVSSRRERIEQAKDDWREGRFAMVPGESEFIPLP